MSRAKELLLDKNEGSRPPCVIRVSSLNGGSELYTIPDELGNIINDHDLDEKPVVSLVIGRRDAGNIDSNRFFRALKLYKW